MSLIQRAPPEPPKKKFANVEKAWHKHMQLEGIIRLNVHCIANLCIAGFLKTKTRGEVNLRKQNHFPSVSEKIS